MIQTYLQNLVDANEIPGSVLAITKDGKLETLQSYGSYKDRNNTTSCVRKDTMFDVASLTKVLATLPAILYLQQANQLSIDDSVQKHLPKFKKSDVTIRHLLQHNSGLPAGLSYKIRTDSRDVLDEIMETELISVPGQQTTYSDLGMILLGKIVEEISGHDLHKFSEKYLFEPWKMNNTTFLPGKQLLETIASTELFQGNYIQGKVHDEKAHQLGGVSGSAGLFSDALDIVAYANYWLYPETQTVLTKKSMNLAREDTHQSRGLGFEVWQKSGKPLSCGENWSKGSFGHTGFTGTSLWVDPEHNLATVFLTNIVHYGRNHRLNEIRKTLHTMIHDRFV
ncbi:serine hydrolase domain-containing protein [Virgibacillus sp. DJP39]|uniref:serine hydrolase domain-containing protein n=1 Tax=Virgibacillus sp. DJP39 TaxID=3409790 RepID=UPI003BB506EC